MKRINTLMKSTGLTALFAIACTAASAEKVTLTERTGNMSIEGELLQYDGTTYVIRTSLGDLSLKASESICEGAGCPAILSQITDLKIAGSGTVTAHLIPKLAEAYFGTISADSVRDEGTEGMTKFEFDRMNDSDLMMTLVHSNSAMGLSDLIKGDLHAAFTTRAAIPAEALSAEATDMGTIRSEAQESVIAYDGLLVVTHPSNPIQTMSEKDIARVFAGDIPTWGAFGHSDAPINVYVRENESNARNLLTEVLLDSNRVSLSENVIVMTSDAEIAEAVKNDPAGIGLTSYIHRADVNALDIEGVCGIRVPATQFTIKTGEYPLSRPIYFYHNASTAHEGLNGFAEFMKSEEAQSLIHAAGFANRDIMSESLNTQGLRVSNAITSEAAVENIEGTRSMLRLMTHSERLSTTFRFEGGSTELDATDYQDLELLAEMINSPEYEGSDFYFMGFSDSVGRADLNQFVALQRAEIVRQALVSRHPHLADRIVARSVGYGEISPLACNETRSGRKVNRRVEVWIEKPMAMASN